MDENPKFSGYSSGFKLPKKTLMDLNLFAIQHIILVITRTSLLPVLSFAARNKRKLAIHVHFC